MSRNITVVMYHFVRDLKRSRYPAIKGLELKDFTEQLEYIRKYYAPVTMEDLIAAARSHECELPPNALLLTFDDGYVDHFAEVFPILTKHRMQGSFFPPAKAILEHRVLDVNKIHFVLAAVADKARIVRLIFSEIEKNMASHGLDRPESYYEKLAVPNRYDSAEVVFIKRVLQMALPEGLRARIADRLFAEYVTGDEQAFASELYMSVEQLRHMHSSGMHIGSHGYDHYWMNTLPPEEQRREVDRSLDFLGSLGCDLENWVMCYPYGGYDESLLAILRSRGCAVGLATEVAIANLATDNVLALPRIDTNDLPKSREAPPNEWTKRAIGGIPANERGRGQRTTTGKPSS
jgi:peptidoglycan/xylan/chitin deacetylase (PgdA/CDA1 family)